MKKIFLLAFMLSGIAVTNTLQAQSCPTGLQDCYNKGSLSGSSVNAVANHLPVNFSLTTRNWCPAGRVDCSAGRAYTVTVTRTSGIGLVSFTGMYYNSSPVVPNTFSLSACSVTQPFSVYFVRSSTTTTWTVALTSVEGGRVCNSQTFTVTLTGTN